MTGRPAEAARRQERLAAIAILTVAVAYIAFGLRTASNSLGCDFLAYFNAAQHWLSGQPIYDLTVSSTGSCGTYQYPPPFVLVAAPFSLLGFDAGNWLWIGFLIGCWGVGTAILPLRIGTRWTVLLLGAIGWPLIFGVRIGQVAPILYLVFAYAWRNLDRPVSFGASVAIGALVKLQPALLAMWLLSRRAWRALAAAAAAGLAIAALAAVLGLGDWLGLATLLRSLTDAVTVSTNMAIGATLHNLGMSASLAGTIQTLNTIAILLVVIAAGLWLPRTPGFLVAVVCTQLISPIVWSHYALLLLLPIGWLLDRRQWWAAVVPIAEVWILVPFLANWTYTAGFYLTLIAVFAVGWRARSDEPHSAETAEGRRPIGTNLGAEPAD
jgi:hypothetical protein